VQRQIAIEMKFGISGLTAPKVAVIFGAGVPQE